MKEELNQPWIHSLLFLQYLDPSFAMMGLKDTSGVSGLIPKRTADMKEVTLLDLSSTHVYISKYSSCVGFRGLLH